MLRCIAVRPGVESRKEKYLWRGFEKLCYGSGMNPQYAPTPHPAVDAAPPRKAGRGKGSRKNKKKSPSRAPFAAAPRLQTEARIESPDPIALPSPVAQFDSVAETGLIGAFDPHANLAAAELAQTASRPVVVATAAAERRPRVGAAGLLAQIRKDIQAKIDAKAVSAAKRSATPDRTAQAEKSAHREAVASKPLESPTKGLLRRLSAAGKLVFLAAVLVSAGFYAFVQTPWTGLTMRRLLWFVKA